MLIFWVIAGVALLLLLLTVVFGDFLDGVVDAIDVTGGYLSSTVVLSFLAAFGIVGGLVLATTDASAQRGTVMEWLPLLGNGHRIRGSFPTTLPDGSRGCRRPDGS